MPELNWGLVQQPDIAKNAFASYAQGQATGRQDVSQNAMMALARDPRNEQAKMALAAVNPELSQTMRGNARQDAADATAQQTATRERYLLAAKLTQDIDTPEKWETAKQSPELAQLIPDVATKTWEQFQTFHQAFAGVKEKTKFQGANLGDGGYGSFNPDTGALNVLRDPNPAKPVVVGGALVDPAHPDKPLYTAPRYEKVGAGENLLEVGGSAPAAPTGSGSDAPRGMRNNNPLNITTLPQGQWNGQTGADGKFAVFASPQDGWNAAHKNLEAYAGHGINTIAGVVQRWAPAGDGANDPAAYAATVSKALGTAPDAPIDLHDPQVREKMLTAMAAVENGSPVSAPAGGARVVASGAPKPTARPATAEEKAAYGIAADVPAQMKPDGTIDPITVPGANGRGGGKLSPQDGKYLAEARTQAQQMTTMAQRANRFLELNNQVSTGPALSGVLGDAARLNPKINEMASIVNQLVPAMRQGLPGAASDRDVAMFRSATVGIDKYGDTNKNIVAAVNAAAQRQKDYVAFMEDRARKNGSLLGAQEEWDTYAAENPMFEPGKGDALTIRKSTPWRKYFGEDKAAAGDAAAPPVDRLKAGHNTQFANGQVWTLTADGKPKRLR